MKHFVKKQGVVRGSNLLWCALAIVLTVTVPAMQVCADQATDEKVQKQLDQFDAYAVAGQGAAAMLAFQNAKRDYPDHPQVRAYEGKILTMQNKMLEAVPVLEANLKDHPDHPLATALLASIEFRMGKKEEATAKIEKALKVHPKAWELLQLAGELKRAQNDGEAALRYWQPIVEDESYPEAARLQAFANVGQVAMAMGKFDMAANSFKNGLAIKWHPAVGMAYIQALDQAKRYSKVIDAIADMRKQLAADNPLYVPLRQQFETQIVPFETRAQENNLAGDVDKLLAELAEGKVTYMDANSRIASLSTVIAKETDPTEKAALQKKLQLGKLEAQVVLLKDGLNRKYSLDWQKERVTNIENLAKGLDGPRVDEAMTQVKQVTENIAKQTLSQHESVLDLAGKGWTLVNFRYPGTEQLNELKERGLPERYDHFSTDLRKTLKDYYTPLAQKREKLELEQVTGEFLKSPTDKALKAKVAKLLIARVLAIDIAKEGVTSSDVIPARVWTEPPGHSRSIDLDEKTSDLRELSYSIGSRLGTYYLTRNDRNEALIEAYSRALAAYPRQQTLRSRAVVYMYTGRYQEALEDFAASVAVAAWEDANAQSGEASLSGNWAVLGIPQVVVLNQIVTGKLSKDGPYPSTSVNAMLVGMQNKNWPAVAHLAMQKYVTNSIESRLVTDIRDGRYRDEIINAMVDEYRKATGEDDKKNIMTKMTAVQSYHSHTALEMLKAELASDPETKTRFLRSAVIADPRNVKASYELGKHYEVVKQLDDAMLTYNIAAGGKLVTQTTGIAKEAATARDRLSGPLANINEALKVYEPHMNNFNTLIVQGSASKLQASQYEALLWLFVNYNGNAKALIGRLADAQRAMGDYAMGNRSLTEMVRLMPERKAMGLVMTGRNEMDLGLYDQAVKSITAGIEAGYEESWAYLLKARSQVYLGQYKEAVESFTKAIEKQEDNSSALSERSELYEYFFDEYDKAIVDLEKALKLVKEKNPKGNHFGMELRLNNLKMVQARKRLGF